MENGQKELKPFDNPDLVVLRNPVAKAKFGLSLVQSKILFEVIAFFKSRPHDNFMTLNVRELLDKIGVETKRMKYYVEEIEEMTKKHLRIPEGDNEEGINYLAVNLLAGARFRIDKDGRGYIDLEVSGMLKPYYLEIAKGDFFSYHILNTRVLKSTYSIKLYLLLKSYKRLGKLDIGLGELKAILEIDTETYRLFPDFKKRVLERARQEINEKNDIFFNYEEVRESPRNSKSAVVRIVFYIQDNPNRKENLARLADAEKRRLRGAKPSVDYSDFEEMAEQPAPKRTAPAAQAPPPPVAPDPPIAPPTERGEKEKEVLELFRAFDKEGNEEDILEYANSLGYDMERVLDGLHYAKNQGTVKNVYAYLPAILKGKAGAGLAEKARQRRQKFQQTEAAKRKLAALSKAYGDLLDEVETIKRSVVRDIVAHDTEATERVIEQLKNRYRGNFGIRDETPLAEFRENPLLRSLVMHEFREVFPDAFAGAAALRAAEQRILAIKQEVKSIDAGFVL